jgi:hypothetical protein
VQQNNKKNKKAVLMIQLYSYNYVLEKMKGCENKMYSLTNTIYIVEMFYESTHYILILYMWNEFSLICISFTC